MKAERFEREKRYQVMMAICRNMLRQGVLSEADFAAADNFCGKSTSLFSSTADPN